MGFTNAAMFLGQRIGLVGNVGSELLQALFFTITAVQAVAPVLDGDRYLSQFTRSVVAIKQPDYPDVSVHGDNEWQGPGA